MENLPATRSILKPSRSSHSHSRSQTRPRKPAVTIAEPALRSLQGKPAQDFTVTFPNVLSARQLEELAFDFARRIQSRRLEDENGQGKAKEIEMASSPLKAGRPTHQPDDYPEFRDVEREMICSSVSRGAVSGSWRKASNGRSTPSSRIQMADETGWVTFHRRRAGVDEVTRGFICNESSFVATKGSKTGASTYW